MKMMLFVMLLLCVLVSLMTADAFPMTLLSQSPPSLCSMVPPSLLPSPSPFGIRWTRREVTCLLSTNTSTRVHPPSNTIVHHFQFSPSPTPHQHHCRTPLIM